MNNFKVLMNGIATVYRIINMLEEIGAISRRNMYKVECPGACPKEPPEV